MIRVGRAAAGLLLAVGILGGTAGCGSSGDTTPDAAASQRTLPPPPQTVPADYTSVAAMEQQLQGVATCQSNGPQSALCTLVTTTTNTEQIATITPFQIKVFATPTLLAQYLTFARGANAAYASSGSTRREFLVGGHWLVTPQVDTSGLAQVLSGYLGGTLSS